MLCKLILRKILSVIFVSVVCLSAISAQGVKRIVVIKCDGLPGYLVERFVKERNNTTGKSLLPWIEEVFYKNGTRLSNFYVRGMSLSGPSWSILDTGQHLQIKGNVEYDRYTLRSYDYLNFFTMQINYGLKKQADMLAVEVLDQLKIPLLTDAFPYKNRYASFQLIQRGNKWSVLGTSALNFFPNNRADLIDEWTMGFDARGVTLRQNERDIVFRLSQRPQVQYMDYFTGDFDHVSHQNKDIASRLNSLRELDRLIGRIWTAIQSSPQAEDTALVLISDHGFNSDERVYSQGFNIVKLLGSAAGGGHHVITKRRLMLDYSIKGIYPLIPLITTASNESFYLKGESDKYPTALVDFDGNERTSFHLRNSDLNRLHIYFRQLQNEKLSPALKNAVTDDFFAVIDANRLHRQKEIAEITEELNALQRLIQKNQQILAAQPKVFTPEQIAAGVDDEMVRLFAATDTAIKDEAKYRNYVRILTNLNNLKRENFNAKTLKIEDFIAPGVMGDRNTVYQLQNYIVGLSERGLSLDSSGKKIDSERSFRRVNYFNLIYNQKVLNNVQLGPGNRPIDFIAVRIPLETIAQEFTPEQMPDEAPVWLYGGEDKQALLLTRKDKEGKINLRYLPIADLRQNADGKLSFRLEELTAGFPLKMLEDENLNVPVAEKAAWVTAWHDEIEWLHALHKTVYSNGLISLNEQMDEHRFQSYEDWEKLSEDEKLIYRFRYRLRSATETDLLVTANNHWNFDVRGFNAGGNHGSFFRVSSNSTFMLAGGKNTLIPKGLEVTEPYDSLSVVPTILRLTGKVDDIGVPDQELYNRGFRKFPGRIIKEITQPKPVGSR